MMATTGLRTRLLWAALVLLAGVPAGPAAAAAPTAVVGTLTGSGYVNPGKRPLKGAMSLKAGDQIVLRSGKLSIRMADGTTIRLGGPAEFTVETPRDAAGRTVFQAASGRVFVNTRQRNGGEVHVVTPSATLAVRGSSAGCDAGTGGTLCWCDEGLVYVDASGERTTLRPGYQTYVMKGETPPTPQPMSEETRQVNEGLNLGASLNQSNDAAGGATGAQAGGGPANEQQVSTEHIAAAEEVMNQIFEAYQQESLGGVTALLATSFYTSDTAGSNRDQNLIQESFRTDFLNLDNIRFFRQPGMSRRFYSENDQVSLRERWVMNAIIPSTGARFQQGGETIFTVGADAGGGGLRVLRWEGDVPFGRYRPVGDEMVIGAPTVITPPNATAPDVIVTQGNLTNGGTELGNAVVQLRSGGALIQTSGTGGGSTVNFGAGSTIGVTNVSFTVNGAQVSAEGVTVGSSTGFSGTGVTVSAGGTVLTAGNLEVSGGTVQLQNATLTDSQGNTLLLTTATINPGASGAAPTISGVTDTGQSVSTTGGTVVYEPAPGTPLGSGRGERLADGQGFQFRTGVVTAEPKDLFVSGGKLDVDGEHLISDQSYATLIQAPTTGYTDGLISLTSLVPGQVLVVKLATGGYAKMLIRTSTTDSLLCFDWVFNPDGPALSRGRRWPTRAVVTYDAKVYSRSATGAQSFLKTGTETSSEFRVETSRNLNNGASVEAYLAPRLTTDRQVDSKSAVVDRFGVRYFSPGQFEASLGDLSAEFSPYSLNQTILGLVAWRNFSIGPAGTARLTTAIGPRWRPGVGFRLDGWTTGIRLATDELRDLGPYIEDMVVGVNLVKAYKGKRQNGNYLLSTVTSVDASLRLKSGISLMAEAAHSSSTDSTTASHGDALLMRAAYRLGPLRFIVDQERVGTNFTTVSGTAAADQERTNLWVRYRPNTWLSANVNFMHTRDNLSGTKAFTTTADVPRYGLSITPFYPLLNGGFLRNLTFDVLWRETAQESDDEARTVDRSLRTLSLSMIQRMGDFYVTVGRDNTHDMDASATGISRKGWATDLSLRWRPVQGFFQGFPISPIIGYRTGRDNYTGGPSGPVTSRVSSQRIGMDLGDPSTLAVELGYEFLDNARTDLGGYDRRVLNIDLTRALDSEGSRLTSLSYRFSNNRQENGARSYDEGQLTGSISQKF